MQGSRAILQDCDIAIIGGGVVGMTLAYGLSGDGGSSDGLRISVLDEGDVAHRASRGNFALIWVQGKGLSMPEYALWTMQSADLWSMFAQNLGKETGVDLAHARRGGFTPLLDEAELERRAADLTRLHNQVPGAAGFEVLGSAALKAILPQIGREVVGATFCPADGHVNSLRFFGALHQAALLRKVDYRSNASVISITHTGDGFHIATEAGQIRAQKVVLAAGLGNARLAPMVGLEAPVRPQRGQVMVTEKLAPFLEYPLVSIRQTDEGGVMIGDSKEEVGFDNGTDQQVLARIAARAVQVFPVLSQAQIIRSWGALRVMSPDGHPIYDQSRSCPGAYLVTCHSGITLAAAHAAIVAPAIASGIWPEQLKVFSAERFANVTAPV